MKNKEFEICVRAIIRRGNKILVCKHKNKHKNDYFFPGGHIDFGESAREALSRELKEELDISLEKISFMGAVENIFKHDGKNHHEINFVFDVKAKKVKDKSLEDHLDFLFLDIKQFSKKRVLPIALRKQVLKWLKNKKVFWASQK